MSNCLALTHHPCLFPLLITLFLFLASFQKASNSAGLVFFRSLPDSLTRRSTWAKRRMNLSVAACRACSGSKAAAAGGAYEQDVQRQQAGYSPAYRAAAPLAQAVGADVPGMEKAAAAGDVPGVLGHAAGSMAPIATAEAVHQVPIGEAVRFGWRKAGNPFGLASTGKELLTQGISPRTSMTNFGPSLERAAGDLKAFDAESPIKNVHDLNDAIPEIKQKIWSQEVEPALQRQATKPVNMKPVAEAVRAQISDEMRTFDETNAERLDKLAEKLEATKDVQGANKLLKYANGQLESYFQKFPAARRANLMNNPETAGWEAARAELRNQFLGTLEAAGETGVRDARLRYGAFDTLQDAVERRVNVADRAKPMSLGRIVGLAGAAPTGGLSIIAGELSNYLNKPDVLIRRGIRNLPAEQQSLSTLGGTGKP